MGKTPATYQKLRGGYYTPKPIADFLAQWAVQSPYDTILEPSCGDGVLLEAAVDALVSCGATIETAIPLIHGVEFDLEEARKATNRLVGASANGLAPHIHIGDFFAYCKTHLAEREFDVVIGNPPFIRYQNFPEEHRAIAFELMQHAGLHPNRLTNAWVPFLVATTLLLKKHGRMAMVIPAELLQVNYAAELRSFLSNYYSYITLITFKKLVFDDIQQEVVLLLGERNGQQHTGIRTVELDGINDLVGYQHSLAPNFRFKEMDHSTEKWTMYFLDEADLQLLRRVREDRKLTISGDVLDVDVGIVTGFNKFFVLSEQQLNDDSLKDYTLPIVSRSAHLEGSIFHQRDWQNIVNRQYPVFLLNLPNDPVELLPDSVRAYIAFGEKQGIHTGFKCRNRKLWYVVPSIWTPDAFMLRQIHNFPKITLNDTGATSTDTIHRVRFKADATSRTAIAAGFLNSLTFAFTEVIGRSYGGGVLELEPNEAEKIPLPLRMSEEINMYKVDDLVRQGKIESVLDITDKLLLRKGLGMRQTDITRLRDIWMKLRDRRINRKPDRVLVAGD